MEILLNLIEFALWRLAKFVRNGVSCKWKFVHARPSDNERSQTRSLSIYNILIFFKQHKIISLCKLNTKSQNLRYWFSIFCWGPTCKYYIMPIFTCCTQWSRIFLDINENDWCGFKTSHCSRTVLTIYNFRSLKNVKISIKERQKQWNLQCK
jgi:hypothetical protein